MEKKELIFLIGFHCRQYRIDKLNKTLEQVEGSDKIKTLSSFEHGKSSNIEHFFKYLNACETKSQRIDFLNSVDKMLQNLRCYDVKRK